MEKEVKVKLIPFRIKEGYEPCEWHTAEGDVYLLGNPDLQKDGIPENVFKIIKKTGRITEIKEKNDGNARKTSIVSADR